MLEQIPGYGLFKKVLCGWYTRSGYSAFINGNFPLAQARYEKVRDLDENYPGVLYNLGLAAMSIGQHQRAADHLEKEHKRVGDQYHVLRALADLAFTRGQREKAKSYYKLCLPMVDDDKSKAVISRRIELASREEAFKAAMEAPELFERGNDLMNTGRYHEADEAYQKCIAADPTHFLALNNRGVLWMNFLLNDETAVECFKAAHALADMPIIEDNLYRVSRKLGKKR